MKFATLVLGSVAAAALTASLAACNVRPTPDAPAPAETAAAAPAPPPAAPPPVEIARSETPLARTVDQVAYKAQPATPEELRNILLKAEVLLDRAHFSPGVMDAQDGENLKNAVAAYEKAQGLPEDGLMDDEVWKRLNADTRPILTDYTITAQDVAGPYTPVIPKDYAQMAKLDRLGYANPVEALAERFHMDEALLKALNPGADFGQAGTRIVVAAVAAQTLPAPVAKIEVDKGRKQVRAYGDDGKLLAAYPATVGSADLPTPSGTWAVRTVAPAPTWTYDPSRLNFGDKSAGKQTIKAGPNNPVGAVWIDLTKDTYGIHGSPDPRLVGKTASHGCVRLTNWDAEQLSKAVHKGTTVVFLDSPAPPAGSATPT